MRRRTTPGRSPPRPPSHRLRVTEPSRPPATRQRTTPGRSRRHLRPRSRSTLSCCRAAGTTRARRHSMQRPGPWPVSMPSTGCRPSSSRRASRWPGRSCRDSPRRHSREPRPWRQDSSRPPACPAPRPRRRARACPPTRRPRRHRLRRLHHQRRCLLLWRRFPRRRWPRRPHRPGTPARPRIWRPGRLRPCRGRPRPVPRQARPWPRGRVRFRSPRWPSPFSRAVCLLDTRRHCPAARPPCRVISARGSTR